MASITKDTIIGEILDLDQTTAPFFLEMGMHCLGCPSSRGETVEQLFTASMRMNWSPSSTST